MRDWALVNIIALVISWLSALFVIRRSRIRPVRQIETTNPVSESNSVHGGGVGIVLAGTFAGGWFFRDNPDAVVFFVLPAFVIGFVGLLDDLYNLRRQTRLLVQVAVCLSIVGFASPLAPLPGFEWLGPTGLFVLAVFLGIWWINAFNFMDGTDGLAASEAIFILLGSGLTLQFGGFDQDFPTLVLWLFTVAVATGGFLTLNWPPARTYMGDTASTYLPAVILIGALVTVNTGLLSYQFWFILVALFVCDASVTLVTRIMTGQKWIDSHRFHAYQRLAVRYDSHLAPLVAYNLINLSWLLPLALAALRWPDFAWWLTVLAYLPLIAGAVWLRAGRVAE